MTKAVPSPDLVLKLPRNRIFLMESGYSSVPHALMTCKPCPSGFFLESDETCSKWPAGSFYQDQLAQLRCKQCTIGQYVPPEKRLVRALWIVSRALKELGQTKVLVSEHATV